MNWITSSSKASVLLPLTPLLENLGHTDQLATTQLRTEWSKLGSNIRMMQDLIKGARLMVEKLSSGTRDKFRLMDLQTIVT